jgi:hypothetical protein
MDSLTSHTLPSSTECRHTERGSGTSAIEDLFCGLPQPRGPDLCKYLSMNDDFTAERSDWSLQDSEMDVPDPL